MDEITSPRPEDLNDLERISIDGTDHVSVSGLMEFLKLGRTSFYARLKELDIAPVRVGRQTYLSLDQMRQMLELHTYLRADSRRAAADYLKDTQLGIVRAGSTALAPVPDSSDIPDTTISLESFEHLERAATCRWLLPTATLAQLLDVQPSTITGHGGEFEALGFKFSRSRSRWKGAIQWSVSKD